MLSGTKTFGWTNINVNPDRTLRHQKSRFENDKNFVGRKMIDALMLILMVRDCWRENCRYLVSQKVLESRTSHMFGDIFSILWQLNATPNSFGFIQCFLYLKKEKHRS